MVGTIIYDISIINVRFYLLEIPYIHMGIVELLASKGLDAVALAIVNCINLMPHSCHCMYNYQSPGI